MTIDDNSSIYVGGLPYDITDEGLRRVFYIYGAVQAVKTIDGRVVRVNEVKTRGGRPNFYHESPRHDMERSIDGDRGRDRGRVGNYDRHRHQEGHRERSQDNDQHRERGHDHLHGHDRRKDRYMDEERFRDYNRHMDDVDQEHGRKCERDWENDSDKNIDQQRNNSHHKSGDKDKHQQPHLLHRSRFDDHGIRELSLESFNDDQDQGESNLAVSNQKLEELRQEVTQMEELVADKQEVVSKLQEKYQKLEDSLVSAKKLTSRRHVQLAKVMRCIIRYYFHSR
ncbi:hypothetical protein DH2020_014427 [Rehmannia glutinosa]|uniref:RRM domain-containing protein n=1 Tax=Rehmannia glutinosa TaxID=99300 RepID=A0ABR0WWG6_REHGL